MPTDPTYIRLDELGPGFREWAREWDGGDRWDAFWQEWFNDDSRPASEPASPWHDGAGLEVIPLHIPAGRAMVRGWLQSVAPQQMTHEASEAWHSAWVCVSSETLPLEYVRAGVLGLVALLAAQEADHAK